MAAGACRNDTGDCSYHSVGFRFSGRCSFHPSWLGLGLVMPEFLVMFVKLSHHCQRGTANTTHLLASEVGFSSGIAVACYFDLEADKMLYTGQVVAVIALIFFILVTYPYYKNKKVR